MNDKVTQDKLHKEHALQIQSKKRKINFCLFSLNEQTLENKTFSNV